MLYKILNQRNQDLPPELEQQKLDLLFHGGQPILKQADLFIPRLKTERNPTYKNKLEYANYHNHLAKSINDFVGTTFSKTLSVLQAGDSNDPDSPGEPPSDYFYREFESNADLKGHSLEQVARHILQKSMHHLCGKAWLGVDLPDVIPATTQLQQEQQQLRPYVYNIPWQSVMDYKQDQFGNYLFFITRDDDDSRQTVDDPGNTCTISFTVWINENGKVRCDTYSRTYQEPLKPMDQDDIPLVNSRLTTFPRIPVFEFCLPATLNPGTLLYSPQIAHFRLKTSITFALSRNAQPVLAVKLADQFDAVSADPNRGQTAKQKLENDGVVVLAEKDSIDFHEPLGSTLMVLQQEIKDTEEEIAGIVHQMGTSTGKGKSNAAQSGLSKQQDNDAKALVCSALGVQMKDFISHVYQFLSDFKQETIIWRVHGLSDYRIVDATDLLAKATSLNLIPVTNYSKTLKAELYSSVALELVPDVSPDTAAQIKMEIIDAIEKEPDDVNLMQYDNNQEEDSGSDSSGKEEQKTAKE